MAVEPLVCAIHQPNFFPWLGYFDKIRRADVFVFLDDVAYPKSGSGMGSWVNRVQINIQGRAAWIGCPVRRQHGSMPIVDARIDDGQPWREKLLRTLTVNYGRSPGFEETMALLEPLVRQPTDLLAEFNIGAIRAIAAHLGLNSRFVRQSELQAAGAATDLLIGMTKAVGADTYMCGGGASQYQDDAAFPRAGLHLVYQAFAPEPYGDLKRYLPGLSVIDFLFWRKPYG